MANFQQWGVRGWGSRFYRFIGAGKSFLCFFYRFISAGKLFLGFLYRFIGAGKLVFGFFYRFIGAGKLFLVFSMASLEKKILPNKIVSLYLSFFQKLFIGIASIIHF
jgi:hypothetical protein